MNKTIILPKEVQTFIHSIKKLNPDIKITTEKGGDKAQNWWIDLINQYNESIVVEWKPKEGFGIHYQTVGHKGFNEGPDEVIKSPVDAAERISG